MPSGAVGADTLVDAFRTLEARGERLMDALFAEELKLPQEVIDEEMDLEAAVAQDDG